MNTKTPAYPWIILGLALAVLLFLYLLRSRNLPQSAAEESTGELVSIAENNYTVKEFVNFVQSDTQQMRLDHAYTSQALVKLTQATSAMAIDIDYKIDPDLYEVNNYAKRITDDQLADTNADDIRKAADILTHVLTDMQRAKYPGLTSEVATLKAASASIDPDVLVLKQKKAIKAFLYAAADLLRKMN